MAIPAELKPLDEFFDIYKSAYPFEKEKALEFLKSIESIGKIQFYEIFLFWFPDFYSLYKNTFNSTFNNSNGFIPITWKYYIGIMSASTNKCEFLFRHLEAEFLLNGGDENWLIYGLEIVPEKLRKLEKINNILAHQPWKLEEIDILEIYVKTNPNYWNLNELVEAILVMVNFHRLSGVLESIKLGLGGAISLLSEELEVFSLKEKMQDSKLLKFINDEEILKNKIINELEILNEQTNINHLNEKCITENSSKNIDYTNTKINTSTIRENKNEESFSNANKNIYDNLINLTSSNETNKNLPVMRKFSEDNNSSKLNSSFENILTKEDFTKHISNYCTVYLDFDSHSDKYKSYFVIKIYNI